MPLRMPPVVIGGTGGSGTRVVQALLQRAGCFMGARLNDAGDALDFEEFFSRSIPPLLRVAGKVDYVLSELPQDVVRRRAGRLRQLQRRFLEDCPPDAPCWGFKHPRSIYLVPLLRRLHPAMVFVHVVRDGRDMALSRNQNQLYSLYKPLYGEDLPADHHGAAVRMWQKVNLERTRWALSQMGGRYLLLRFEDLCEQPEKTARRLLDAAGFTKADTAQVVGEVRRPASIGRWQALPPDEQDRLTGIGKAALSFYGYLPL